jgi:Na+/H+ antiporter NhaD/arsenite permease-like protein
MNLNIKIKKIIELLKKDVVFLAALTLAVITSVFIAPKLSYIDFKVIITLFNLMLVVKAYEKYKVLDYIAIQLLNKCKNVRYLTLALIGITFFASMFITNDVALLTFVPLTIIISKKSNYDIIYPVVLITMAANLGSALMPMGNPQNLYIYSYYHLNMQAFFGIVIPMTLGGLLLLLILNLHNKKEAIVFELEAVHIEDKKKTMIFTVLFIAAVLSVFNIISYKIAFIMIIVGTILLDRTLIKKVDYKLLLTFVCFFIAIGNLSALPVVRDAMRDMLGKPEMTYLSGLVLSQVISNVPAAILLSAFTTHYDKLLLGVNIGGLGTIIASLASVISYRIYSEAYPNKSKRYLMIFSIINIASLIVLGVIFYFFK